MKAGKKNDSLDPTHQHMKLKYTTQYLFLLLFVVAISACSSGSGMIWDYANISFKINVTDREGHSLILPDTKQGEAFLSQVSLEWGDEILYCEGEPARSNLRAMIEGYHALYVSRQGSDHYSLVLGELQPNYSQTQHMTLHFPGGTSRKIEFQHYVSDAHRFITRLFVDGKKVMPGNEYEFTIVLSDEEIERSGYRIADRTPAPQTIYFHFINSKVEKLIGMEPSATDKVLNKSLEPLFKAEWRGKELALEHRPCGTPIDLNVTDPHFYYGTSRFLTYPSYSRFFYLGFGPLPEETLKEETLTIHYPEGKRAIFSVNFSRSSDGTPFLSVKDTDKNEYSDRNISYFRNGIIIEIPEE